MIPYLAEQCFMYISYDEHSKILEICKKKKKVHKSFKRANNGNTATVFGSLHPTHPKGNIEYISLHFQDILNTFVDENIYSIKWAQLHIYVKFTPIFFHEIYTKMCTVLNFHYDDEFLEIILSGVILIKICQIIFLSKNVI